MCNKLKFSEIRLVQKSRIGMFKTFKTPLKLFLYLQ